MSDALPVIVQGDTYPLVFTFTQDGALVDVTGWIVRVVVKTNLSDPDASALFNGSVTGAGADGLAGKITVTMPQASTRLFPVGTVHVHARRQLTSPDPDDFRTLLLVAHRVVKGAIADA